MEINPVNRDQNVVKDNKNTEQFINKKIEKEEILKKLLYFLAQRMFSS